jgi:ribosomal protein S18 acetylase RimI-like enzyme
MGRVILVNKQKISYSYGDQVLLDRIKLLWEELNEHHCQHSSNFKDHYIQMTFEKRKFDLLKKSLSGKMRVDLAVDEVSGCTVGYCVSSLNGEKTGEIESIFVNVAYRGLAVGDALIKNALLWMDKGGAAEKIVEVGDGNEQVFGFYSRYGFLIRKTVLKQVKK